MANSAQARKRARQAAETNKHNSSLRSTLRTAVKQVRKAIAGGDKAAAMQKMQVLAGGHRSHRRQEDRPQEPRVAHEVAARAGDQSHGLTRVARSVKGASGRPFSSPQAKTALPSFAPNREPRRSLARSSGLACCPLFQPRRRRICQSRRPSASGIA